MKRRVALLAVALAVLGASPGLGSGGPSPSPLYLHRGGGTAAELAWLQGRTGIILARAPDALLYLHWRQLHGLSVSPQAIGALTEPCCGHAEPDPAPHGDFAWLAARRTVLGETEVTAPYFIPMDRPGPNYTSFFNCFADAFETAAATLRDRAGRYGAASGAVRAWLRTQDAVFDACANPAAALPAAPTESPAWLRADRAYQEAAFALYNYDTDGAAARFAAIGRDRTSPWRPMALYLRARAFQREALAIARALAARPGEPEGLVETLLGAAERPVLAARRPLVFARARAAVAQLAAAPAGSYGRGEARRMRRALDFRERPDALRAELDRELNAAAPAADLDFSLRDYLRLSQDPAERPDAADWILTLKSADRAQALAHARERWGQSRDTAWLIAALSLVNPGEEGAEALAADAADVAPDSPGRPTAQYHHLRLTAATAGPAETRARLDAMLADPALTLTERNLLTAARAQVAADLGEFARFAVREPYCLAIYDDCSDDDYYRAETLGQRPGGGAWLGWGDDARAVIDRMPLAQRIALSRDRTLPDALRLDLALTSFARAVQLRDDPAIDALAGDLAGLLPQLRDEWRAIPAARPGPAKRFATLFAMAKIPGLRTDLADYLRPHGTVAEFQRTWVPWRLLPPGRGAPAVEPPQLHAYWDGYWFATGEDQNDLICLGKCGLASFPLQLPPFVAAAQAEARRERAFFLTGGDAGDGTDPAPPGTVWLWDEALAFVAAHPRDARAAEMLYWLIRIGRWGGSHDHLGRRAFQLLHRRYAGSDWARRSPYYYD